MRRTKLAEIPQHASHRSSPWWVRSPRHSWSPVTHTRSSKVAEDTDGKGCIPLDYYGMVACPGVDLSSCPKAFSRKLLGVGLTWLKKSNEELLIYSIYIFQMFNVPMFHTDLRSVRNNKNHNPPAHKKLDHVSLTTTSQVKQSETGP